MRYVGIRVSEELLADKFGFPANVVLCGADYDAGCRAVRFYLALNDGMPANTPRAEMMVEFYTVNEVADMAKTT